MTTYLLKSTHKVLPGGKTDRREFTNDTRARGAVMFLLGKRGDPEARTEIALYRAALLAGQRPVYLGRAVYQGGIMPVWVPAPG